ncbi:MAG TPA: hypothetical protein VGF17_26430 [Phytomonospora sp.]
MTDNAAVALGTGPLGVLEYDQAVGTYCATVTADGYELWVCVEARTEAEALPMVPLARRALADFVRIADAATLHLWKWGSRGDEPEEDRTRFWRQMVPSSLVLDPDGGFAVHFEDCGDFCMDGYWPAVHFDDDFTPVDVSIEA